MTPSLLWKHGALNTKAAQQAGVTPETIRIWIRKNWLDAYATPGGQKIIKEKDIARAITIANAHRDADGRGGRRLSER